MAGIQDPLSGHPGHLSVEQNHILGKFKAELTAEGYLDTNKFDDAMLLYVVSPKARFVISASNQTLC